jgi:cytidylate kinase
MVIAIDGPAGAGKSTVARGLAAELGFTYLDSGAMYRSVALAALRAGIDPGDADAVTEHARGLRIALEGTAVTLDGEEVGGAIRTPEVTEAASLVSAHPGVREAMVAGQRAMIEEGDYVAEGRDIGTVVSPDSPLMVFLVAGAVERARRRAAAVPLAERMRRPCGRALPCVEPRPGPARGQKPALRPARSPRSRIAPTNAAMLAIRMNQKPIPKS